MTPLAITLLFIVFAFLALSGSWIADGFFLLIFDGRMVEGTCMIIISLVILGFLGVSIKSVFTDVHFDVESHSPHNARVLVIFLSPVQDKQLDEVDSINRIEDFSNSRLPWEMSGWAIKYHVDAGTLERVEVVTSPESDEGQFQKFKSLVGRIFSDRSIDINGHRVQDSEDVKDMYNTLESIFKSLKGKYRDMDIVIDVTGGKKPATIARVLASVYHFTEVQYVSTTTKEVKSYYVEPTT